MEQEVVKKSKLSVSDKILKASEKTINEVIESLVIPENIEKTDAILVVADVVLGRIHDALKDFLEQDNIYYEYAINSSISALFRSKNHAFRIIRLDENRKSKNLHLDNTQIIALKWRKKMIQKLKRILKSK